MREGGCTTSGQPNYFSDTFLVVDITSKKPKKNNKLSEVKRQDTDLTQSDVLQCTSLAALLTLDGAWLAW